MDVLFSFQGCIFGSLPFLLLCHCGEPILMLRFLTCLSISLGDFLERELLSQRI